VEDYEDINPDDYDDADEYDKMRDDVFEVLREDIIEVVDKWAKEGINYYGGNREKVLEHCIFTLKSELEGEKKELKK
jgi:septum formation topological specificity factor MinE